MLRAIFELAKIASVHNEKLKEIDNSYLQEQVPELTYIYYEQCKNAAQEEKIEYFRNIWINSVFDISRALDEKVYVFDLIGRLRTEQILVLKLFYEKQGPIKQQNRQAIEAKAIAKALDLSADHVQQICISLVGIGLLHTALSPRREGGPNKFTMIEYVQIIGKYLSDFTSNT